MAALCNEIIVVDLLYQGGSGIQQLRQYHFFCHQGWM
jgi:hypothetical protein